ncbi:MAG: hypothetical protein WAL90_17375 [Desulfobacterales bacterium]
MLAPYFIFSADGVDGLMKSGANAEKISLVPRSIDIHRFQPAPPHRRSSAVRQDEENLRLVYCGPVTRENNFPLLAEVFKIYFPTKKPSAWSWSARAPTCSK